MGALLSAVEGDHLRGNTRVIEVERATAMVAAPATSARIPVVIGARCAVPEGIFEWCSGGPLNLGRGAGAKVTYFSVPQLSITPTRAVVRCGVAGARGCPRLAGQRSTRPGRRESAASDSRYIGHGWQCGVWYAHLEALGGCSRIVVRGAQGRLR